MERIRSDMLPHHEDVAVTDAQPIVAAIEAANGYEFSYRRTIRLGKP